MKTLILSIVLLAVSINLSFAQWAEQTSGVTTVLNTVSSPSNNVAWAGGAGGVVRRTTDGGTTWTSVGGGAIGTAAVYNIFAVNDLIALCTTSPGATFVYLTVNGGVLWTQVFTEAAGFIDAIWMTDATNGFMIGDPVGARWSLWRTTTGGTTWDSTGMYLPQAGSEAGWINSLYKSGNNIWFGTSNTRIYYSTNNGSNWVSQPTPGLVNSYSVWLNSTGRGFASQTIVVSTTNNGTTWATQTLPGTGTIFAFAALGTTNWWYGRGTGIYTSADNGTTFASQYTAPAGNYNHLTRSRDNTNLYAVRTNGGISKFTGPTGIVTINNNIPSNYSLSQNYPNPFNPSTKINFSIPKSSNVTIKIFDVVGNEVKTVLNESVNAGEYYVSVDASNLASGVYFYKIIADGFSDTKRMTLLK